MNEPMNASMNTPPQSRMAVWQPFAQQRVFRRLMEAFSYPGRVVEITEANEAADALTAVLATLLDSEVSLADPEGLVSQEDWPRLEARAAKPEQADFILAQGARALGIEPRLGSLESPERSATLILRVAALGQGAGYGLSGPGVNGSHALHLSGLDPAWLAARATWNSAFPTGVDLLLVDATRIAALPRTTRIHTQGEHGWDM